MNQDVIVRSVHEILALENEDGNLRLGDLINALRQTDVSKRLIFENVDPSGEGYDELKPIYPEIYWDYEIDPHQSGVGRVHSWRGLYSQLALNPSNETRTVHDTLTELENTIGRTLEGYKGGDFLMDENTPVWCSDWGKSRAWSRTEIYKDDEVKQPRSVNLAIKSVMERENEVVILYEEVYDA